MAGLSLRDQIKLRVKGRIPVPDKVDKYYMNCRKHGRVIVHPQGYEERFECPQCFEERVHALFTRYPMEAPKDE